MLFHLSFEADNPQRTAQAFAELWGGVAHPFPPVATGSWMAMAGDDRGTGIEVYPRGTELRPADGDDDATSVQGTPRRFGATHAAVGTPLSTEAVMAIAEREGWPAKICFRGGSFHVIELWIDGCQMMELLTPEMQREYLEAASAGAVVTKPAMETAGAA